MKFRQTTFWLIGLFYISTSLLFGSDTSFQPVTPNASPEAKALLNFLYDISGEYTLTGQHNYPNTKDRNTRFAAKYIGKTPIIYSQDWGHAKAGDTDSYLARPDIVKEAIRLHREGAIITICWHAVPPTADEPITFRQLPGAKPDSLVSVQGQLLDEQFKDVLTPGTELHKRWCAQVDTIAVYLKQLQDAHVPVLWRPYHEMNGGWFWWGGRIGEYSTRRLYQQLFDRYTKHHKLNNLIWVWSVDRPNKPGMQFSNYYPGNDYLDIVALDVYGRDFQQIYYDSLMALSKGKPLALGEVGNPPTLEILESQPNWTYYVIWAGMVRNTLKKQFDILVNDPRVLSLEDSEYWKTIDPYRAVCNLAPLPLRAKSVENTKPNFSGEWILNEDKCVLDNWGPAFLPYKLEINQKENDLNIRNKFIMEFGDNRIEEESLTMDGKECKSELDDSPKITTVNWSEKGDSLIIISKVTFTRGEQASEMTTIDTWSLQEAGKILSIQQISKSFWGERNITMIFDKQTFWR